MTTTGTVTSDDGTSIAFTKLGQGPALILVDGALCFRQNGPSRDLASLLASRFTVYAYDRRGRGESGDTRPYAIAREAEDLKAIIRQAGDSVFVFGSSSGAALAMEGAAAGLPIRKLVLYEPPIGVTRPEGPPFEEARREVDALVASGDNAGAARYFLSAMLDDRSLLAERAARVAVPALAVGGAKSPEYMQQAVARVAKALPNARALTLPGQGHDVSAAGKALLPAMTDFYASDC